MKMNLKRLAAVAGLVCAAGVPLAGQSAVSVKGDEITITGCVNNSSTAVVNPGSTLVWTRGDLLLSAAAAGTPVGTSGAMLPGVLYYLDDADRINKHVGQMVEVKGDLKDIDKARIEVDRDGDFMEVKLKFDGDTEKVRVPTAWFGPDTRDQKYDVLMREIDVDDVKVLGACPVP